MKAIFIDAKNQTVSQIEVENDLQSMYDKIGCRVVQVVEYRNELIVCDEEARLKPWEYGFALGDWRICGSALIVSDTEDGDFADTKMSAEDVAREIRFFGTEEKLPEPMIRVIAF